MVKQLSESPAILHAAQNVSFHSETWLPQSNKFLPLYDEFVGMMWRMPHLTGLRVHGIGELSASLVDFMIHNKALKDLELSDVTIPPPALHLQIPSLSYRGIHAVRVTGDVGPLFSHSSSTLQRLRIFSQFPIQSMSFLSNSPTNRMPNLVELGIWKSLTEEQASWFVRLLPCCPVLERLSIHDKFPSPMSAIPPHALPRLSSLVADEDGHALALLDSSIRRVSSLTLTLKEPLEFRFLRGVHSQPVYISGEIAYAYLTTPNDDFHRLVQNCERFYYVFIPSSDPVIEITPTARILTLMPSLEELSIIFRLPRQSDDALVAKSWKKPQAIQVIKHWLQQADQSCPLLRCLSIKVKIVESGFSSFVFDCVCRQRYESKKWRVQIWKQYYAGQYVDKKLIADVKIVTSLGIIRDTYHPY